MIGFVEIINVLLFAEVHDRWTEKVPVLESLDLDPSPIQRARRSLMNVLLDYILCSFFGILADQWP